MTLLATLDDADADLTACLARVMAAVLKPGDVVALQGPVGAGKTHFARAFIRARQGEAAEEVPSPTFTLVQTYADPLGTEIWHADLYRLTHPEELAELGLDEAMREAVVLVEWPEHGSPLEGALTIGLEPMADAPDLRRITLAGSEPHWGLMTRLPAIAKLIHRAGWSGARLRPLAGDASSRRYFRLVEDDGRSAVLMDASPGVTAPYVAMTQWLRALDLHAPEILATDQAQGLLLIEDLGDDLVARVLESRPELALRIYDRMTDLLVQLHGREPPDFVPRLDGPELAHQVGLFAEYYPPAVGAPGKGAEVAAVIERLHAELAADLPPVLGLRDFHAENVVWRDEAPLGLLDFQDAVAVHPAYDLVSALQDARRDVAPEIEAAQVARYIAATGVDEARFRAAYALLGAQRNLRIMGIFTRLAQREGKRRYLAMMPRVWAAIRRDLAHPALAPLAAALEGIPAPTPEAIEGIAG
ncbi:tRNA (adenosine(37)-N6)-threonylcarbamoyltransferase complex ATPase subunit type 1 TsaE [Paracoccus denitrificans]|uniref:tRNA (adenosine(37)-N6)-threonylcarbamoyltransferase complex ATPase subunit type 1 TsaE n=1 Tax=Paracoccus denitrificans TaxID=266 RepID=UPI001E3B9E32|nr:tRNA (adenosine(37)-N6)-threonylcarbamoyltransferase complex ATPase subunit type 1 TsaE [Paracoccus denitrificans]UFS66072.1 tRNA (adenosine(37)-N6)-threonylcarbamoyltransferase complex ATPase subunit type 1 TsaE [Paracoccus denitrificans]